MHARFPEVTVNYVAADFRQPLDLPPLDGMVMGNTLHFQRKKVAVLQLVRGYLRPDGLAVLMLKTRSVDSAAAPESVLAGARDRLEGLGDLHSVDLRGYHEDHWALIVTPKRKP